MLPGGSHQDEGVRLVWAMADNLGQRLPGALVLLALARQVQPPLLVPTLGHQPQLAVQFLERWHAGVYAVVNAEPIAWADRVAISGCLAVHLRPQIGVGLLHLR